MADTTRFDRRQLLRIGGTTAAALAATRLPRAWAAAPEQGHRLADDPFRLGVASGDPVPDGVVLWTRLAPDPLRLDGTGGMPARRVAVRWEVAEDATFRRPVRRGAVVARPEHGHAVHVDVRGLRPDRWYHYRFTAEGQTSRVGRTRTAPGPGAAVDHLAFAFASCQNYPAGHYTSYQAMLAEDVDLVVHLGDYIYEGGAQGGLGRGHLPRKEVRTLAEYRVRHAQYRTDPDLQAMHAAAPWVVTWDDHEVENNWADEEADPDVPPAAFLARRAQAFQAYYEHMPLRQAQAPVGPDLLLHRKVGYGSLATFHVLDTRQYRSDQAACRNAQCAEAFDPARTILGDEQEQWLYDGLAGSAAAWNVLAQQVPLFDDAPVGLPADKWDGYVASRQRLLDFLDARDRDNTIAVTGDVHFNTAGDLKLDFDDPGSRTLGSEFVGTSISSGGDGNPRTDYGPFPDVPHMAFTNHGQRGYVRCDVTPRQWRATYRVVDTVESPLATVSTLASFVVDRDRPGIQRD